MNRFFRKIYLWLNPNYDQNFKPVILVTGCGSGIGLALASLLEKELRYRIVVTARKQSIEILRTQFLETNRFMVRELDVTSEPERIKLINEIDMKWGGVNVLVNNAGISYRAVVEHMTEQDEYIQMSTNYFGPMGLIRLVLPNMRHRGRGKIINVSSVSGMLAMPTMASYSASKHALEGACESLWYETKPFGIDICLVQPGFVHSNSFERVRHTKFSTPEVGEHTDYRDFYIHMTPFVGKLMALSTSTPHRIAQIILHTIKEHNPPLWIPATFDALVFYYIRRIFPRRLLLPFLFFLLPNAKNWGKGYTKKKPG